MPTKVLIVDDDRETTDLLKIVLAKASFEVYPANTGKDGLTFARQIEPHVIILDLYMPDMDGWQVCKELRSFCQTPILILSAMNRPGMMAQVLEEGADDYLLKPTTSRVLIAHLNMLLRRARIEQEPGILQNRRFGYE